MDKKELKWYVAPAEEIIEMELEGQLLDGSNVPGERPDDVKDGEFD